MNFIVKAELDDRKYYSGQEIKIKGHTNKKAYISLLGYSPKTDMFETIVPNPFEPSVLLEGNFQIPSKKIAKNMRLMLS